MQQTSSLKKQVCPFCQARLADDSAECSPCATRLAGVRLYDPASFVWLAFAFSGLVPIYLAASNWGQLRQRRRKFLWLGLGVLGFAALFTLFSVLPTAVGGIGRVIGFAVNLSLGFLLGQSQRPLYEAAVKQGARPASLFKGLLLGLGFVVGALALAVGGMVARYNLEFEQGVRLLEQEDFPAAASVFQRILRTDPDDPAAQYRLAWCQFQMRNWDEAGRGFEHYLKADENNSVALALLSRVRFIQGRSKEGEALAARARALDPQIFESLFGSNADE
ncbi:MAG: tetratricopeptide repeat protein [Planctomycetaceae bacterium]